MKRTMARLAVAFSMGPALAAAALAAFSGPARAGGDGRLLTTDAAEALDAPVLGLQRSALPLAGGVAIDTALLADLGLVANLGLRWAAEVGVQRFVAGARWAQFVGAAVTSSVARQYDAIYDDPYWEFHDELTWRAVKTYLPRDLSSACADLGCGTGKWGLKLLKSGFATTFVDHSAAMIEQVRERLEGNPRANASLTTRSRSSRRRTANANCSTRNSS